MTRESLPTGTVTFLFTDVEGSTRHWELHPEAMRKALAAHDEIVRGTAERTGGIIFASMGDGYCIAFSTPATALRAAIEAQRALQLHDWGELDELAVRIALHTGDAEERDGNYFGAPLNRCARLLSTAHGGQVVVSLATEELLRDSIGPDVSLLDLGAHALRDLHRPEQVFQVVHPGLRTEFPPLRSVEVSDREERLAAGQKAHTVSNWPEAYGILGELHAQDALHGDDLMRLGDAAYWLGRIRECLKLRELAFAEMVDAGEPQVAAKLASGIAKLYLYRGAPAVSRAWARRAESLVADAVDSEAYGYVLRTKAVLTLELDGDLEAALDLADKTLEQGIATGSRNLQALGLQDKGRILVRMGEIDAGMTLIDEAMVAAVGGELDPDETGISYCNMLDVCKQIVDYQRAAEWSDASEAWCAEHSTSAFPGICRIYRAELMWLRGRWQQAAEEAEQAIEDLAEFKAISAMAWYQLGEIRLRAGDYREAEEAFKSAHAAGKEPLPGMAMLRMMQGDLRDAESLLREGLASVAETPLRRAALLGPWIEVQLALGKANEAEAATEELAATAASCGSQALSAAAAQRRGAIALFHDRPGDAKRHLSEALRLWREVNLPYEVAQCQVLMGRAHQGEGNDASARLEFESARSSLVELGATDEAGRVE